LFMLCWPFYMSHNMIRHNKYHNWHLLIGFFYLKISATKPLQCIPCHKLLIYFYGSRFTPSLYYDYCSLDVGLQYCSYPHFYSRNPRNDIARIIKLMQTLQQFCCLLYVWLLISIAYTLWYFVHSLSRSSIVYKLLYMSYSTPVWISS
jgi:hypothetical protein